MKKIITVFFVGMIFILISSSMISLAKNEEGKQDEAKDSPRFKEVILVGEEKLAEARQLSLDIQQAAVDAETDEISLGNLLGFTQERADLVYAGALNVDVEKRITTTQAFEETAATILPALGITQNVDLYQAAISEAFIQLQDQVGNRWFTILSNGPNQHTTYTYNMLFLVEKGSLLMALPLILTVDLDASKEKVLQLRGHEIFDFKIGLQGLEIMKM
ncbi:hypothetical protein [Chengkuizengella marina]|uniref:Toxin n=1 Tax=Chengkuizengella marina TaxID=2507566 RepID=A0A6N9Q2Z1_9BACL|nr:hypothetical protein [Chengkuizengella marina]NBI29167.1 hypothetical protein [Chengkuizengella marina]